MKNPYLEQEPYFSIVIPAHNEEQYIDRCIKSIEEAAKQTDKPIELIVVCNRCTDRTAGRAMAHWAKVVYNEDRCIAKTRNAGIREAQGEVVVTIDADNQMTPGTLSEIDSLIQTGKYMGGGAPIKFERYSFPLILNDLMCRVSFFVTGLYCGIFWAKKESFDAIGGFVEIKAMEDVATAKALRKYGRTQKKKYTKLRKNYLINSTRKFDDMGDWLYLKLMFKNIGTFIKAAFGKTAGLDKLLDEMFYDYNK